MKTQLIICGLFIIALGSYNGTDSNADQRESTVTTAVNELAVDKPIAEKTAAEQLAARGEYLEVHNTAVASGAQPETGTTGDETTLAWKVREGSHLGVPLDGLAVVAVVFENRAPGVGEKAIRRATLFVDARANESQQAALVAMANALTGDTIHEVVAVKPVKIDMNVCRGCAIGYASLVADTVTVRTRRMLDSDKTTANLEMARPMLADAYYRRSAFTLEHSYSGGDFEGKPVQFIDRDLRSAVVGGF